MEKTVFEVVKAPVDANGTIDIDRPAGSRRFRGFHNFLETWAKETPMYNLLDLTTTRSWRRPRLSVPKDDPMLQHGQKITARKGSLVVWSSRLPHCNYPKTGSNFWFVQYIRMAKILKDKLPKDFAPSTLGRLVFGLAQREGLEAEAKDGDKKKCLLM